MPVGGVLQQVPDFLSGLGMLFEINEMSNEISEAIPFTEDRMHAADDWEYANRF
jgi:hypothetical protein